jgi:hypothetical protein
MPAFWNRWFGKRKQDQQTFSLVDYAENYLSLLEIGTLDEKSQHAAKLVDAANDAARHVGAEDFLSLLEGADVSARQKAAAYARQRFDAITSPGPDRYWLAAYALTHLMILNHGKFLDDSSRAKQIATNAAHIYGAEYIRRENRGSISRW